MTTQGFEPKHGPGANRGWDRYPGRLRRWWAGDATVPGGAVLVKSVHRLVGASREVGARGVEAADLAIQLVRRFWWSRLSRRRQHAFVVVCGVLLAVGVGLTVHESAPALRTGDVPTPVDLGVPSRIEMAKQPVVVPVRAGSVGAIASLSATQRRSLARKAAGEILAAIEADPRRVAVIQLLDMPLSFAALPFAERRRLELQLGGDPADRYETAVSELLDDVIDAIEREQPKAILTVLGLPVEPEEAGMNLLAVQRTNERYDGVLERVGPFVPARRFVVFGSSLDERMLAKMGMREALRLRQGRPIIFQTNLVWRALVDEKPRGGRDYHLEAVLGE